MPTTPVRAISTIPYLTTSRLASATGFRGARYSVRVVAGAAASEADLRPAKIDEAFDLLRVCTQFEHDMLFQNVNDFRGKHIPQLYETNAISFSFAANLLAQYSRHRISTSPSVPGN